VNHEQSESDAYRRYERVPGVKEWVHPTVRRGTFWWTLQVVILAGLALVFLYLALADGKADLLLYGIAVGVLAVFFGFFARREIHKLRHEYRYEDNEDGSSQ